MATKLTKKQKEFVGEYLQTGNGTQAALKAYNIGTKHGTEQPETVANAIAVENLQKPSIIEAIRNGQKDDQISEAFEKLINLKRLDYFVFPKSMSDEEITEHVQSVGIKVVNIRPSDKGKLAFFAIPDGQALARALDMVAKIQGAYAPTRNINLNVEVEASPEVKELTKQLNDLYRGTSSRGNGGSTSSVGTEAQD